MKFSIITPAWEIAKWLPAAIESVLSQEGDFEIEYIVVADQSKDNTVSVAKEYEHKVSSGTYKARCNKITMRVIVPEKTAGMYVAINRGFAESTGDVQAWLAGDDLYEPGAFQAIAEIFTAHPDIQWVKGISSIVDESGALVTEGQCRLYHQDWLRAGVYGMEAYHVEQESVFWRAGLWKKAGPFPAYFKSAGDYWLWPQIAKYARLVSAEVKVSCFRKREGQDSRVNVERLLAQKRSARPTRPLSAWWPRTFFWPYYHFPKVLQPLFETLYPFWFPLRSRMYLSKEHGVWVKKIMWSFVR